MPLREMLTAYNKIYAQINYVNICIAMPLTLTLSHHTLTLTPSQEAFTLVLKGHIALCTAVFPNKTNGEE